MQNTETGAVLNFDYISPTVDLSGGVSNYASANVPGVPMQVLTWVSNSGATRQLQFVLAGDSAEQELERFKDLQKPIPNKFAPAVCRLKIGNAQPVRCVIESVQAQGDLRYSGNGNINRINVTLGYREVPLEATTA